MTDDTPSTLYRDWLLEGHEDTAENRADFVRYLKECIAQQLEKGIKDGSLFYDEKTKRLSRRFVN